jgi:hypothetical protein
MIKRNWILVLFGVSVLLFAISRYKSYTTVTEKETTAEEISAVTFRSGNGWGYDILKNGSIFIHQEFIPAIAGRQPFVNEAEAKRIANLMIGKMKSSSKLPDISLREIDSCGITHQQKERDQPDTKNS